MILGEMVEILTRYSDMRAEFMLYAQVSEDELQNRLYKYPWDSFGLKPDLDNIEDRDGNLIIPCAFRGAVPVSCGQLLKKISGYPTTNKLYIQVSKEEFELFDHHYPCNQYVLGLELGDIGHSDKRIILECRMEWGWQWKLEDVL